MSTASGIGHALIDAIIAGRLLRSDDEEPRLLVWSANAPEQLGALADDLTGQIIRERDGWEEWCVQVAYLLGCREEWSSNHDHRLCVFDAIRSLQRARKEDDRA